MESSLKRGIHGSVHVHESKYFFSDFLLGGSGWGGGGGGNKCQWSVKILASSQLNFGPFVSCQ